MGRGASEVQGSERRFVALLRAVNVGGHGSMRMADLRAQFEAFGLRNVATYIQSGNVLFTCSQDNSTSLAKALQEHLAVSVNYRGPLFVLSSEQLAKAASDNPFHPERPDGDHECHLMFLSDRPDETHRQALLALQGEEYRFAILDKVLYYAYPKAYGGRRRTVNFEAVLGVRGTARNWRVVDKLVELASAET